MLSHSLKFAAAASAIGLATAFTPVSDAEAGGRYDGQRHTAPNSARDYGHHGHSNRDERPRAPNSIHDFGVPRGHGHQPHWGHTQRGPHGHRDRDDYFRDRNIQMENAWRRAQREGYGYGYPAVPVRPAYPTGPHGNVCIGDRHASVCLGF